MPRTRAFWGLFIAVLLAAFYAIAVLLLTRQVDILLIFCIIGSTLCFWGAWFSFLKKKIAFLFAFLICLISLLFLTYATVMDVTNPELIPF